MPERLGQHFLKNTKAITTIIDALHLEGGEAVIEIGPGKGVLTLPLLQACKEKSAQLIAIEKDPNLVSFLRNEIQDPSFTVHEGDVRKDLGELISGLSSYILVGNLPYYLTSYLFRIIESLPVMPKKAIFMIQKEVALRISAAPPEMNLLAASIQAWAKPQILQFLHPSDFSPPPKVDSAILALSTLPAPLFSERESYYRFIKALFKQPRKTILNNLASGFDLEKEKVLEILKKYDLSGTERPQDLSVVLCTQLASSFSETPVL